jgi:CarD family transcriptional regulator
MTTTNEGTKGATGEGGSHEPLGEPNDASEREEAPESTHRALPKFDVGDKVVYPHHGAAIVERREHRVAFGQDQEYLVLRLAYGDLTLMVPVANAEEVGLREVINDEEVEEVFAVLRKKEARMPANWSRRYKNHVEKLKSGDIYQVAEVVRNLSIRDKDKGLSAGEKRMLSRARQILVSELTFALNLDEEAAERKLDEVLP